MLYALGQPAALAGLLVGFVLAVAVRTVAIRATSRGLRLAPPGTRAAFNPRHDIDPFGAVAALIGGLGWGRTLDVTEVPRYRGRLAAAAVFAAGPVAVLVLAEVLFGVFALTYQDDGIVLINPPSIALTGAYSDDLGQQFFLSTAVATLCFAIFTLLPIPPLDGFGLLWSAFRVPTAGISRYKHWFADNNVGVAVLLALFLIPFLRAPLFLVIETVAGPLMRVWT